MQIKLQVLLCFEDPTGMRQVTNRNLKTDSIKFLNIVGPTENHCFC